MFNNGGSKRWQRLVTNISPALSIERLASVTCLSAAEGATPYGTDICKAHKQDMYKELACRALIVPHPPYHITYQVGLLDRPPAHGTVAAGGVRRCGNDVIHDAPATEEVVAVRHHTVVVILDNNAKPYSLRCTIQ